jgi:hypothetical protein
MGPSPCRFCDLEATEPDLQIVVDGHCGNKATLAGQTGLTEIARRRSEGRPQPTALL